MGEAFLRVEDLRKHYGEGEAKVEVLRGITAALAAGEVCVLLGPSGSGKSTWAIKQMQPQTDCLVSRDNIRFMLLKDEDDYFAKEKQVKQIFFEAIKRTTREDWESVFIDATHLTSVPRFQTLQQIANGVKIIAVSFEVPVDVAIERNSQRTGRALVPESVIKNMAAQYKIPAFYEGFNEIWHVDAEGNIIKEVQDE
jgi:predicted kinase